MITASRGTVARAGNALVLAAAAAALGAATLAAVSLQTPLDDEAPLAETAVLDDGLPGEGMPPSPGPTNPNGAG